MTGIKLRFTPVIISGKVWYDSNLIKVNSSNVGLHLEIGDNNSHYLAIHQSLSGQKFTSIFHEYFGTLFDRVITQVIGVGQIIKIRIDVLPDYGIIMGDILDAGDPDPEHPDDVHNGFASQDGIYFRCGNSEIFCFKD